MDPSAFIQEYFQIRSGDTEDLNADTGWAAGENVNATIGTGLPFRIRFKVRETDAGTDSTGFKLQVNRNSGGWVDVDVLGGLAPAALAVLSSQFDDGDPTSTELLTSTTTYVDGEGLEVNSMGNYSLTSEETEFEWCLMIMGFHDGPAQNIATDELEFRVVEADGTVFGGVYTNPTITVSETPGYIGGTYAEHPCRIGPFKDTNGNLYAVIEYAESQNDMAMIKSTDGGDTWRAMDAANRPTENDIEGIDVFQDGDTLHIAHAASAVYYHRFQMSDHASPDTWEITDEVVDNTITGHTTQVASLAKRSDGTIVMFYVDAASPDQCLYKIRNGSWGSSISIDTESSINFVSPFCVLGANDLIHLLYKDDTNGIIYHRSLNSSDVLSDRETIKTGVAITSTLRIPYLPPIYYDSSGDEKIMLLYQQISDQPLSQKTITNDGSPSSEVAATDNDVEQNEGSSHKVIASADADGTNVHLFYVEKDIYDIWRTSNDDEGGWITDVEEQDAVYAQWFRGFVFTHSSGNGGDRVFGYIWDNGSSGGTGFIQYDEYVIAVGGGNFQDVAGVLTTAGILSKETSKTPAGSITGSGILVRSSAKAFIGSITAAGILATSKVVLLAIGGTITAAGVLIKQTSKSMTGGITAVGSLVKQTAKIFVGSLTPIGTLIKQTAKSFIGSVTAVGSLATQFISGGYYQIVGGVLTMSGILTRQTNKIFTGSVTTVGSLVKQAGKVLLGSLTTSGILATTKAALLSISGSLTPSGILIRQTGKIVLGSLAASGSLIKQTGKAVLGSLTATGSLVRQTVKSFVGSVATVGSLATHKTVGTILQVVGGVLTTAGTLTRQTSKTFAGSLAPVGILVKRTAKAFIGSITAAGSLATQKSIFRVIDGALTMSGILVKQTSIQTTGIITMAGSITKRIGKSFTGAITAIGTLARQLLGLPVPAARIYAIESENRVYAVEAEIRIYAIASENRTYPIPG